MNKRLSHLEEALAIYQRLAMQRAMAFVLSEMALVARDQCDYDRARALCEQSLEIYQTSGRTTSRAYVLINLASIEHWSGNLVQSVNLYREGLRGLHTLDDREAMTDALEGFGEALVASGDYRARGAAAGFCRTAPQQDGQDHSAAGTALSRRSDQDSA